jgi:hypothetical protein
MSGTQRYDRKALFDKALLGIQADEGIHFIQDVVSLLGIASKSFYNFWAKDSKEYGEIEALLFENRSKLKKKMRFNWAKDGHPALQMGLYKLIGTDDERNSLTQSRVQIVAKVDQTTRLDVSGLSTSALLELKKKYYEAIPVAPEE